MSDTPSGGGIGHILSANKNRVGNTRVDKIEADAMSKIVERIAGVNPSDPWGQKKAPAAPPPARMAPAAPPPMTTEWGNSPAHQMSASRPDAQVQFLHQKVAMLEQRLAKYEVFNGADNDVVSATTTPAREITRGADSSAYGSGSIRKKNAKSKDPVDGKPDGQAGKKEAPMAGERVNILGMSMNEWRSLANLPSPAVDLTQRRVDEEYEDEIDETTSAVRDAMGAIGVKVNTPAPPPSDPEKRKAAGMKPLPGARGGSTVASRGAMADVRKLASMGRKANEEFELWAEFLSAYDTTPEQFAEFAEAAHENSDEDAISAICALEDEFHDAVALMSEGDDAEEDEEIDQLWAEWLESHDLSVDAFNMLVDAAETDEEFSTLESIQAMFEAEIAGKRIAGASPTPAGGEIKEPGKAPQKLQSVAAGQIKPSRKGNFSLPAAMRAKMGLPKEEEDTFECDDDGNGHPDMKHPAWKKFAKKAKR